MASVQHHGQDSGDQNRRSSQAVTHGGFARGAGVTEIILVTEIIVVTEIILVTGKCQTRNQVPKLEIKSTDLP